MDAKNNYSAWWFVIAFALFLLLWILPANAQVVVTKPPVSCITTCSSGGKICATQCY